MPSLLLYPSLVRSSGVRRKSCRGRHVAGLVAVPSPTVHVNTAECAESAPMFRCSTEPRQLSLNRLQGLCSAPSLQAIVCLVCIGSTAGQQVPASPKRQLLRKATFSVAAVASELESTSRLVHRQSMQQVELMQVRPGTVLRAIQRCCTCSVKRAEILPAKTIPAKSMPAQIVQPALCVRASCGSSRVDAHHVLDEVSSCTCAHDLQL